MAQSRTLPNSLNGVGTPSMTVPIARTLSPATRWAFYAWMFAIPYDYITPSWLPVVFQGVLSIPRMAGLVLSLAFVLDPRLWPWKLPPASVAFAAFFGIFTLSMLRDNLTNFVMVFQQFQMIMLFLICYNLFVTGQATRGALLSYAISCGIMATLILSGVVDVEESSLTGGRLTALGLNPNEYSEMLLVGVLVAIGLGHIRRQKGFVSLPILWGIAMAGMVTVARSGSRGQTLALAVGLAALILRKGSFWARIRNLVLMAVVGGMAFSVLTHTEVLLERWTQSLETGATAGREKIFDAALEMVRDRPFIGWGPSATIELADRLHYPGEARATHNMVLAMLTFTGLAGSIPYFYGYLTIAWSSWRARSGAESVLPLAIFLALFVGDSVSGGLPAKLHWTFFAYLLAAGFLPGSKGATSSSPGKST
jgi:O-antigen ligase